MLVNFCRSVLLLAVFLGGVGIVSPVSATSVTETVIIGGTGSGLGTMRALGRVFEQLNPNVRIKVLPSLGTTGGLHALEDGAIDIALTSRPLTDSEKSTGASVTSLAKTPIVFVTATETSVANVTLPQIQQILTGQYLNWPDEQRVRLVLRPAGDTITILLRQASSDLDKALGVALSRNGILYTLTDQENAHVLQGLPGGFGFSTLSQIISEQRPIKVLSFEGAMPSVASLAEGRYPLHQTLSLVFYPDKISVATKSFFGFVASEQGQRLLITNGNLPLGSQAL